MATYRIYYLERELSDPQFPHSVNSIYYAERPPEYIGETEWEETYDGADTMEALEAFFNDHGGRDNIRMVEEDGSPRELSGFEEWDADRTYVWVEDGKYMEYQGLDVATPGMVSCPLCDGTGEVDEETAERFAEEWEIQTEE